MQGIRYYKNAFEDFSSSFFVGDNIDPSNQISDSFKTRLKLTTTKLMKILKENNKEWLERDYSIYTGSAGIAYTYYHYGKYYDEPSYIDKAKELLERCIRKCKYQDKVAFLTGIAGPVALAAIVAHLQHKTMTSIYFVSKLRDLSNFTHVLDNSDDVPNELLYGRAGYLSALLCVNANISPPPIEGNLIKKVVNSIIDNGIAYSRLNNCWSPLMYSWHDKEYIGAAHGLAGILYLLLQARQYLTEEQINSYIKPSLRYIQGLQFPSGNFPSSTRNRSDRLVQWCHGAPGIVPLFCLAHEVFDDKTFLNTAIHGGEIIWREGLLKKGYGICHGVAGNAYAFIYLFQQTKDTQYLYQACKFAEWCFDFGMHEERSPDRPFSLFEGLAGVIYFLIDMQQLHLAKFPAYDM